MFKSSATKIKEERTEMRSKTISTNETTVSSLSTAYGSLTTSTKTSTKTERIYEETQKKIGNGTQVQSNYKVEFNTDAAPFKPRRSYEPLFRRDPITNLYSTTSRASPRIPEIGNAFLPSQSNLPPPTPPNTVNSTPTTRLPPDNFGNSQTSQGTVLKVKVTKTKKFHDGDTKIPTYSTHSKERGKVLVLNNIKFSGDLYREGAKLDEKNVVSLFQQMGFDVKSHRDKTKKEMEKIIKTFAKQSSLKSVDICIVVVMSHGTGNERSDSTEVVGIDNELLHTAWILEQFDNDSCSSLAGKPKIFIFQCCRGNHVNVTRIQTDSVAFQLPHRKLSDMLIAYSTVPGYVSHRNPDSGSWYMQTICEVFMEHAHDTDVESMLKIVDSKLALISSHYNGRQTSSFENRGFKTCYLHPK